ncbi:MAG: hydantoin utilization protein A [Verrucomicrobia bacterium]|nr:hydantoin utilization protein A [Verrucomicrobiota bacterium]
MLPLITGLAAGALHVMSGPDHLAAVAPLATHSPWRAWKYGVRWGLGHSGGVAVAGVILLALRDSVNVESVSGWAELTVGLALIAVGIWSLRRAFSRRLHSHPHAHGAETHLHFHAHSAETSHGRGEMGSHHHNHAATGLGALHGLAGSSHLFALLPAMALPQRLDGVVYLAGYSVGTIIAMALFAHGVSRIASVALNSGTEAYRWTLGISASLTLVIGIWWVSVALG